MNTTQHNTTQHNTTQHNTTRFRFIIKKILFLISIFSLISCSLINIKELNDVLKSHKYEEGIEDIRNLIKNKDYEEALYQSAVFGYSDIVKALIKIGADINAKNFDGSTPLIWACRNEDLYAALILMQNGADPFIKDAEGLNAFQNIKNIKKRVIFTGSISHKENKIVSERLNNIVINSKGIIPLLEEINKKVINEMNDAANKKLYTNAAVSKYIKNPQYEFNDTYNSNKINNILKIGNKYYYILCVGVPSYVNGKTEYLDSYISVWEINGSLSISQISSMNAGRFVSGFNGIPLSDDINIVSKNQYLTIEDHANFEEKEYKYYTFVIDNDTFYLDRISLLDSRNNVHTLYLYSDKDTARLTMHDISYTLINSVLGINYYGIYK